MKKVVSLLMVFMMVLLVSGCKKEIRSYIEMKKDQKKAINKFISEKGIETLHKYPTNGKFGENQFFLIPESGVYLHVVDPGNGTKAIPEKTEIIMRCSGEHLPVHKQKKGDTTKVIIKQFDLFENNVQPIIFKYIYAAVIAAEHSKRGDFYELYLSKNVESALEYVGDQAIVKMIIPFEEGSSYQISTGEPIYYDKIKFVFD